MSSAFTTSAMNRSSPKIEVFDRNITPQGWLDRFSSLQWVEKPSSHGWFELWCPLDSENLNLLAESNILWLGDSKAMFIERTYKEMTEDGLQICSRGWTLEKYFMKRILWGTHINKGKSTEIVRNLANLNAINPINSRRKIPLISLNSSQPIFGNHYEYQKTGGFLHDEIGKLLELDDLGWEISFNPRSKSLQFTVLKSKDYTVGNAAGNDPIQFDSDMEDILSSSYFKNISDYKNVALVSGAGEGADRKKLTINDANFAGLDRNELDIDARDLSDQDEQQNPIPEATYLEMLRQRGLSKLAEYPIVETYDANFRIDQNAQYQFGVDFDLGDWVSVQDKKLGVSLKAKITEVQKIFDEDGYSLILAFGFTQPSLTQRIQRML